MLKIDYHRFYISQLQLANMVIDSKSPEEKELRSRQLALYVLALNYDLRAIKEIHGIEKNNPLPFRLYFPEPFGTIAKISEVVEMLSKCGLEKFENRVFEFGFILEKLEIELRKVIGKHDERKEDLTRLHEFFRVAKLSTGGEEELFLKRWREKGYANIDFPREDVTMETLNRLKGMIRFE